MKSYYYRLLIIILGLNFALTLHAKVDPPNYDFSIDTLNFFMPGQGQAAIEKKFGVGTFFFRSGPYMTKRYYVAHIRYRFAIFVQYFDSKVVDFHASLPAYFLHDIFHHSLIKRIGPQNKYLNTSEQSVYVWNNVKGSRHVYSGACTITCFPLYYAVMPVKRKVNDGYEPLLERLKGK
jgi:hypothetical protein